MQFLPTTVLALCIHNETYCKPATFSGLSVITYLTAWGHNLEDCNANILLLVASCVMSGPGRTADLTLDTCLMLILICLRDIMLN